jgi:hypothetical protein
MALTRCTVDVGVLMSALQTAGVERLPAAGL